MAAISTAPLYTPQNPGWNYEAMPYHESEVPAPLPARSAQLPWERKEALEKERQEHNMCETQKAYDEAARQKARGGFFNNVAAAVKPRWAKIRSTPRPVREAIPSKRDERRFNNKFHFPCYERLLYASELCKTISGSQQILGKVYVSENFFCFRESRLQPKGGRRQRLLLVIPIDEVLSISQAEIASQPDPRYAPEFRQLDQWHSKADGLFLYTRDSKVHRFYGFWTQQTYHDTFNVLDRQWRTRPLHTNPDTLPLRAGESAASRSVTSSRSSASRTLPVSGAPAPAALSSRRSSNTESRSSGKMWSEQRRTLPQGLLTDIKHTRGSRLRHVGEPCPRFGHVLVEANSNLELVPIDSTSDRSFARQQSRSVERSFGLQSQSRQARDSRYAPKQHQQQCGWQNEGAREQEQHHMPTQLAEDIKHANIRQLHHVDAPQYAPAGIALGHVSDNREWHDAHRRAGYVQRERLGFQTVQQRLHTQQRGRVIDSQLKDEISHFNLRGLRHVQPTVRQWTPSASDVKMRIPANYGGEKKRHHHHHHHRHTHQASGLQPVQIYQFEEYDIVAPGSYEEAQANKLEEQLKRAQPGRQQQQQPDRWATSASGPRTFEAGTA